MAQKEKVTVVLSDGTQLSYVADTIDILSAGYFQIKKVGEFCITIPRENVLYMEATVVEEEEQLTL